MEKFESTVVVHSLVFSRKNKWVDYDSWLELFHLNNNFDYLKQIFVFKYVLDHLLSFYITALLLFDTLRASWLFWPPSLTHGSIFGFIVSRRWSMGLWTKRYSLFPFMFDPWLWTEGDGVVSMNIWIWFPVRRDRRSVIHDLAALSGKV